MATAETLGLIVVGSIGIDTIETPAERREEILGGSVSYACAAASFFAPVGMVGVVGSDFPAAELQVYRQFGIDLQGLQRVPGKTFRWSGVYEKDLNRRRTLCTELNVFADFAPELPPAYRRCPFVFLANIAPELQLHVLAQAAAAEFVAADTMDLWINTARPKLMELIAAVDMLTLNESEARLLAGEDNLMRAAQRILGWGPSQVLIKKGEHGSMLVSPSGTFMLPAYPVETVIDPTGAGDAFAGGLMGCLARERSYTDADLRRAMCYGSVVAAFGVEAFGLERLRTLTREEIEHRLERFLRMLRVA
jgi:sugar/nucleoside kinase (ribokinase family)